MERDELFPTTDLARRNPRHQIIGLLTFNHINSATSPALSWQGRSRNESYLSDGQVHLMETLAVPVGGENLKRISQGTIRCLPLTSKASLGAAL